MDRFYSGNLIPIRVTDNPKNYLADYPALPCVHRGCGRWPDLRLLWFQSIADIWNVDLCSLHHVYKSIDRTLSVHSCPGHYVRHWGCYVVRLFLFVRRCFTKPFDLPC